MSSANFIDDEDARAAQSTNQVKKYALKLLKRWPYILIFFVLSLAAGHAINRYATPIYQVNARITTKKFSNKPETPIPGLIDANFFLHGLTEVYEEIPILKSPRRIEAALNRLEFDVSYFIKGDIKTTESITGYGFTVTIDSLSGNDIPFGIPIYVNYVDSKTFELESENEEWHETFRNKRYVFGDAIQLGGARLRIFNTASSLLEHDKFYFVLNGKEQLVNEFRNRLQIEWVMEGSAMLDLYMESELPEREIQFLNAYYEVVQEFGIKEKNETLDNTIRFIDTQMKYVTDSLLFYQSLIDDMKFSNRELNLPTQSNPQTVQSGSDYIFARLNELDQKKAAIQLNERYFDYLLGYFQSNSNEDIFAPSLMGLSIPLVEAWVNRFINEKLTEKMERNEANRQNPLVNREDSLRRKLEKGIFEAIRSERQMNRQSIRELAKQAEFLLGSVPAVQGDFRKLAQYQRLYQLNLALFDLFLRRKTEAAISKASAISDYEVIEVPSYSKTPIKPDKKKNLLYAAALGLFLPVGLFLLIDITNKRIMDKDDLLAHTQIPVLGNVAHSDYPSRLVMKEHPRSVVSESFRAVRANLKFLAAGITTRAHTFLITSSVGGEGKTFCSLNLAYTLAQSQKSTIVIGADMRKPKLANYLNVYSEQGLSGYLAGYATLEELILKTDTNQPDFIDAGKVPPNPSELLAGVRMRELMTFLKDKYDYIIIDTPPIGLVSDAMELFKYSDYNILIVRQRVTHKAALDMVNELYLEGKLQHFSVVFNDIELIRRRKSIYGGYVYGMGYGGYGYGYYEEDKGKNGKT